MHRGSREMVSARQTEQGVDKAAVESLEEKRGLRRQWDKRQTDENTQMVHQLTAGWGIKSANTMKQSADRLALE